MIAISIELFVSIIFLFGLIRSIKFGLLSPYFLVMAHLTLGIPVRYFILKNTQTFHETALIDIITVSPEILLTLGIGTLFFIAFLELTFLTKKSTSTRLAKHLFSLPERKNPTRQSFNIAIFATLSLIIYATIMTSALGGVSNVIYAFSARVSDNIAGLGYTGLLSDAFITSSLILLYLSGTNTTNHKLKYTSYIFAITAIALLIIQSGRGNLIQFILSAMIVFDLTKKRQSKINARFLLILTLTIFVTIAGLTTRVASQRNIDLSEASQLVTSNISSALSAPFALYDHFYLSTEYVNYTGYNYGLFYLENILRPIPRSIWPEKPQPLGKLVREQFWGDSQGGIPPGLFGEFYISFGFLGVFLLSGLFGVTVAGLHKIFLASYQDHRIIPFTAIITPYICFNLIRGGFDVGFTRITIYCVLIITIVHIYKMRFSVRGFSHSSKITKANQ